MSGYLTFVHSGDMGDVVAGLGAIRDVCQKEGVKARVFLDTSGGKEDPYCLRQTMGMGLKFNQKCYDFLKPLIEAQPYVVDCNDLEWVHPNSVDYNMNAFRALFFDKEALEQTNQNLLFSQQLACGVPLGYTEPWLTVPKKEGHRKVLAARSNRYHSSDALYLIHKKELEEDGAFVGTDLEYSSFKDCTRIEPRRVYVSDALGLAQEIQNSDKFLVNGTLAYWLAVGMGHPNVYHELGVDIPTTLFPNKDKPSVRYFVGNRMFNVR